MKRLCIICGCVIQPLLADHARDGATPSKWPTETARAVAVGHVNGVAQAQTLEQMHRGKGRRCVDRRGDRVGQGFNKSREGGG